MVGPWSTAMELSTKVVALSELTVYYIVFLDLCMHVYRSFLLRSGVATFL